jgi:H+/Cl- antiporter ClcA
MFHRQALKPTKLKHIIYLIASTILGVLLSFLVHVWIELVYLDYATDHARTVRWYGGCSLPWIWQIILPIIGVVGGLWLGRWWWRVLYVEQRWRRR